MHENAIRTEIKSLAATAQAVVDGTGSPAEKRERLDKIEADVKQYAAQLSALKSAQHLMHAGGALSAGSSFGAPGVLGKSVAMPRVAIDDDTAAAWVDAVRSRKSFRVELGLKAATTGDGLSASSIPAYGGLVQAVHEPTRVLDLVPVSAIDVPVLEVIQHVSTDGGAEMVAPGGLKPTATLNLQRIETRARKIAVIAQAKDEDLWDVPALTGYVQGELQRLIVDAENTQALLGDGTGENLLGLLNTSGILTRAVDAGQTSLDAIEDAITDLRVGAAKCEPSALVLHPATWSAIRKAKDSQGRYLVAADPTADTASSVWGVPVMTTTSMPVGTGLLMDAERGAQAFVRNGLTVQSDFGADGFETNQTSFRAEERVGIFSPRPAALLKLTGLGA